MMTSTKPRNKAAKPQPNGALAIFATLADTTWRIVVPTISLALLGIGADLKFATKPWCTLLGTLLGFGIAGALIKRQLKELP
ncbi:AtpZ/AtpI family protein [Candidatus Saccharibacteria bacterium]|nr:AtpZ/AtpI family protein [Candidatus Saccharibacteria bacterium]